MGASAWQLYASARKRLVTGLIDLDTDVIRAKLFKIDAAASVSSTAVTVVTEISAGGNVANVNVKSCTNVDVTAIAGSVTTKFTFDSLIFTASGGNATSVGYCVLYTSSSSLAIAWCKLSTASFDVSQNNTLTITTPTNGAFVVY